jgi:hypothetical protein
MGGAPNVAHEERFLVARQSSFARVLRSLGMTAQGESTIRRPDAGITKHDS